MIVDQSRDVSTNLTGGVEFSISTDSAKLFALLSNVLYRDKERSVMTELCSNAIDAHKMVDKEHLPIQVTMPSQLCMEFRVRDFGTGLSDIQVYQFLTQYGASSKGNSNECIGGFGIGSKSPAAVTDTWTVNSHFNGVVTSFLIHVSASGIPSINKLFTKHTDESGLEVIVPVKNFRTWLNESHNVFEHYEVMPVFKGGHTVKPRVYDLQYKDLIKFGAADRYSSRVYTLINRRLYHVDLSKVNPNCKSSFMGEVILPFNTGELSISLSREDLQFDARTINAINSRVEEVLIELNHKWQKEVECAKSLYNYIYLAREFKSRHRLSTRSCEQFSITSKYSNLVMFDSLHTFKLKMTLKSTAVSTLSDSKIKSVKYGSYGNKEFVSIDSDMLQSTPVVTRQYYLNITSEKENDVAFVMRDHTQTNSRVQHACKTGVLPSRIVILEKEWFDMAPNEFIKVLASSLDKAPVKPRNTKVKVESEIFAPQGRRFERWMVDKIGPRPLVCLTMKNSNSTSTIIGDFDSKFFSIYNSNNSIKIIAVKEGTSIPSYAITPLKFVEDEYDKLMKDKQTIDLYILKDGARSICPSIIPKTLLGLCKNAKVLNDVVNEIEILKNLPNDLTWTQKSTTLHNVCELLGKPYARPIGLLYRLYDAYPMLKITTNWLTDDKTKILADYINSTGE